MAPIDAWDTRIARRLVPPLARAGVTPNQVTIVTAVLAVGGALLFAPGDGALASWGAALFVLARFFDHVDGELARMTGASSRLGYHLDYVTGALSYSLLFACIGLGVAHGTLGGWALLLGGAGAVSALLAMPLNMGIDRAAGDGSAVGYPSFGGFELEDGIYLIAPVTWLGWLPAFLVPAGIGALVYLAWTGWRLARARAAR